MLDRSSGVRLRCLATAVALTLTACEPLTGPEAAPSIFEANVTGSINASVRGAAALDGNDWTQQLVGDITPPDGKTVSAISLRGSSGEHSITLVKRIAGLATGTFVIGPHFVANAPEQSAFYASYLRRTSQGLEVFPADSGTITITSVGDRVQGTFTLYADEYDLLPLPGRLTGRSGPTIITPIGSGSSPVQITGTFDAPVRRLR